jgi:hypothetical protein
MFVRDPMRRVGLETLPVVARARSNWPKVDWLMSDDNFQKRSFDTVIGNHQYH